MCQDCCRECGQPLDRSLKEQHQNRHRFCNRACYDAYRSKRAPVILSCELCGKTFVRRRALAEKAEHHLCSSACRVSWLRRNKVRRICEHCGKTFYLAASTPTHNAARFCSRECAGNAPAPVIVQCEQCGGDFTTTPYYSKSARFCSKQCRYDWDSAHMLGPNNPNFKHGLNREYGHNWLRQRQAAIIRDGTCRICGATNSPHGADLDVHHIVPLVEFGDWRKANRLSNLITLCRQCHNAVESGRVACPTP